MIRLNSTKSRVGMFIGAGVLAVSLAGCSMGGSGASPSASTETSSPSVEASPTPLASVATLTGVDTEVAVDAGFVDALTTLGLTPAPVGSAGFADGAFTFPITGGNVDYYDPDEDYRPFVQGIINHEGSGLSLSDGTTTVELTNFTIDPGTSMLYGDVSANGSIVVEDAHLFRLNGSTLEPLIDNGDGTVTLTGTKVFVSEDAAALLNDSFGTDAVTGDLLVGVSTITINGA